MKKVLIFAAHPDDEVIGVGGTVHKLASQGYDVHCCILGEGMTSRIGFSDVYGDNAISGLHAHTVDASKILGYQSVAFCGLPDNAFDKLPLLEVVHHVESVINDIGPEIIFTHHFSDLNIDHRVTFQAVMTATRPVGQNIVSEIYCFETYSSTEWNFGNQHGNFSPNVFVDISLNIDGKLKAMSCYATEIREYPHPRSLESLEVNAKRWGTVSGCNYAEAFVLMRSIRKDGAVF